MTARRDYLGAIHVDTDGSILLAIPGCRDMITGEISHIEVCTPQPGSYVRAWKTRYTETYQLCQGGGEMGPTLMWRSREEDCLQGLADGCEARIYRTRAGFDRACETMDDRFDARESARQYA